MRLFDTLGVEPPERIRPHEPAGRFIPLTQIRTSAELSSFIVDIVPLLHATRPEVEPIQYVISELVRNVIEHAGSPAGAFVCAQYYKAARRLALGVADAGIGLRDSLGRNYSPPTDLESIYLAMRPGVSGTSPGLYGTDYNAGAGLFFTKSIARASDNLFVMCSGRAFFKLLKTPPSKRDRDIQIYADPKRDRHVGRNDLPSWPGTVVGIDIAIGRGDTFAELLAAIRSVYSIDKAAARAGFKKPQFI